MIELAEVIVNPKSISKKDIQQGIEISLREIFKCAFLK
jgi:hypothetical protein